MNTIHAEASRVIDARPEQVYAILADYRTAHPAILPKPYFTELTVESGGQGAGTIIRVRMKVFGQEFAYRQKVTEPEPGRKLVETDIDTGQASSFTIDPVNDGRQSRVTIATDIPASPGLRGVMESLFTPSVTRRIFEQELQNLAEYVRSHRPMASAA